MFSSRATNGHLVSPLALSAIKGRGAQVQGGGGALIPPLRRARQDPKTPSTKAQEGPLGPGNTSPQYKHPPARSLFCLSAQGLCPAAQVTGAARARLLAR